ncbi:DUF881 domain-containing protein [Cellulomonas sp. JZ18]|uniref:DUF881 domain-containing protein n=1 Tax=Cellulomonas sp. JZ18 TaxID=2654191 RepID=UPI0012D4775F|nr:DUF881 domain-containing protein [Cellulomonas sp. JZ18]QGQ19326.1 DUF881 domain-containing protein [Cellulomonas sp. JZ18]
MTDEHGPPTPPTGATPAVPEPPRPPLDDAPVIDPRDPLGLGDLLPDAGSPTSEETRGPGDEQTDDLRREPADGSVGEPADAPVGEAPADDGSGGGSGVDDADVPRTDSHDLSAVAVPTAADEDAPAGVDAASGGPAREDRSLAPAEREDDASPGTTGHEPVAQSQDGPVATGTSALDGASTVTASVGPGGPADGAQVPSAADEPLPVPGPTPREPDPDAPGGADEPGPSRTAAHPAAGERSAWSRLAHAMRPRITTGQLLTAALCAMLGLALVVQVRQTTDAQLGSLRQDDLVRLLDETTTRADELAREAADLQRERDELLSGSDRQQAALDAARRNAATQGILTGRLPATGPGVRVTLHDADPGIRPATMLHVLEELRNAGAEAIQLNDLRVTASSAFTGTAGAVVLDGVMLSPPYRWLVIGDPDTIATALEIPGGAIAAVRRDGGRGTVERVVRVDVTALRELPDPVHATPVPGDG